MQFDDFEVGAVFHGGTMTLSEAEMIEFARAWDPQPFHIDPERARVSQWGGIIGSGWQTSCAAMRLFCDMHLVSEPAIGSPGVDFIRFIKPVRPGDTLRIEVSVLDRKRSKSKPDLGIIRWHWKLYNQKDEEVYSNEGAGFFDLSPREALT